MHNMSNEALEASPAVTVSNASSLNSSPLRSSTDDSPHKEPKRYVEVDFRELADGTLVEMIEDPEDATKTLLAICKNGQVRYSARLECGNQVFVPIPKNTEIIRYVQLANGSEDYESLQLLLGEIVLILADILQLSNEQLLLLSFFVLSTWFIEKLPIAPYIAFIGLPGSGKTTALRILNLLCYRRILSIACPRFLGTIASASPATAGCAGSESRVAPRRNVPGSLPQ